MNNVSNIIKILFGVFAITSVIILTLFFIKNNSPDDNSNDDKNKSVKQLLKESKKEKLNLTKEQIKELDKYGYVGKNKDKVMYIFVDLRCGDCQEFEEKYGNKFKEEKDISYQHIPTPVLGKDSEKLAKKQIILNERSPQQGNQFAENTLRGIEDYSTDNFKKKELKRYNQLDPIETSQKLDMHSTPSLIYKEKDRYYKIN